jgi:hypothetical protein
MIPSLMKNSNLSQGEFAIILKVFLKLELKNMWQNL